MTISQVVGESDGRNQVFDELFCMARDKESQIDAKSRWVFLSSERDTVDVVDCGLTSHSATYQLYSDGTDVQFPHFDLLPGIQAMGS